MNCVACENSSGWLCAKHIVDVEPRIVEQRRLVHRLQESDRTFSRWEEEFIDSCYEQLVTFGGNLTEKQIKILENLE